MRLAISVVLLCLAGVSLSPAWAEAPNSEEVQVLRNQIQELQAGQKALREELKAMKKLLTAKRKPRSSVEDVSLTLNVVDDPAMGSPEARVTLIEFTDYQCPFCARHSTKVLPQIAKTFIDTGKLQYILRDFPIASIHPHAAKAHEAAHCASEQGKYWEMHDQLFAHHKALQPEKLGGYAQTAGVTDTAAFQACVESGKYSEQVTRGLADGSKAGIRGTPSFLLGVTEADGTVKVVKLIRGAQPFPAFQQHINTLLAPKPADPAANTPSATP
jgi:protein-disulfide isomerase